MSDYYIDKNGNIVKKKKTERNSTNDPEYTLNLDGSISKVSGRNQKEDEIAPIKEEEKPWYKDFFRTPDAFKDDKGNVFTDTMDTIHASWMDFNANTLRGIGNLGEGVTDLLLHGVSGVSNLVGADSFADDVKNLAKQNTMNDFFDWAEDVMGTEKNSIFGETTDSVAQGIGQVGGIILTGGLGATPAISTAITTGLMGASSMGSGISEAYQNNATDGEAWAYGATKGVIDAGSELIFGGLGKGLNALGFSKGLSSADDMLAKKLSSKISNLFFKNLAEGSNLFFKNLAEGIIKAGAEGVEEVLAGLGTAAAKQIYDKKHTFGELLEDENLFEQFVVGALTSGITQGGDVMVSTQQGKDLVTGLNKDETSVVDKVYEAKLKEAEADGKKLSPKKKNDLYESVIESMDRGELSLDTIEEVLGGDSYKAYKDTVDSEEALKTELEELRKMPMGERNDIQNDRLTELKAMDFSDTSKRDGLKAQLRQEVFEMTKGTRLGNSYVENYNKHKAFTADLSKYEGKAKDFVEQVIKSKTLNNSRLAQEKVDFIAKAINDLGIEATLTSDAELQANGELYDLTKDIKVDGSTNKIETGLRYLNPKFNFAVKVGDTVIDSNAYEVDYETGTITFKEAPQGNITVEYQRAPNGWYDAGKMTLNSDNRAYLSVIAGHEITHDLSKKAKSFAKLQNALFEYAKATGEYDSRRKALEKVYEKKYARDDKFNAKIDEELTADLVGEYIFTDNEFLHNLLKEDKNVFQQLWDSIKHLAKMATSGSAEARELEKAQMRFEQVWREGAKATKKGVKVESDAKQYSLIIEYRDNTVEELADARNLTNEQAVNYLKLAKSGKLKWDTYIPVRKDTPQVIIDTLAEVGERVENRSLVMQVRKARQSMAVENQSNNLGKHGDNVRKHALTPEEVVEIVNNLDNPSIAILETNRHGKNGEELPDVVAVFVDYNNDGKEGFAVIEFESSIDPKYIGTEIGDTNYHTIITVFEPDVLRNGMPYDYAEELLSNPNNIELDIKRRQSTESAIGKTHPNTLSKLPSSDNILTEESDNVKQYSLSSIANTFFDDPDISYEKFSEMDYKETQGYKDYVEQCVNNYRQTRKDFVEADVRKEIEDSIDGIIRVAIASAKAGYNIYDDPKRVNIRDSKKRLLFSSLEPNSEYTTSHDVSAICDKRKNFSDIHDDIVRAEKAKGVPKGKGFFDNIDNYFALHKIMADKGLTQPCRQCYVESMRKNLAPMANSFLTLVQETNPNNKANKQLFNAKGEPKANNTKLREAVLKTFSEHPEYRITLSDLDVEMLSTEDGLARLKIQAPLIYEAFNSFYGQAKPKMPKQAVPFRFGELTALLTDENGKIRQPLVDKINSTGGFRLQSYSDFQTENFVDVLQVIFEAGTLGLSGHSYTKVPNFLTATEGTNLKRNISIFMYKDGDEWKLDYNDSFPYSLEEIYDIVNADKTGNTGIIAVSQNADMSAWIMANDMVGYGIPFHKSGMKMATVRDTDVKTWDGRTIKGYSGTIDHTKQQTEVWAKAGDGHKALTKVKNGINIYEFWDFDNVENLTKNKLIEKNVKRYIDECERLGYLPKFRDYVMNKGNIATKVLEYSKKLGFASQDATIEDISFQYKGYTIPYGYYKFLGDFGMFTPDGQASPHEVLSLKNYAFDKAEKFFADAEGLRKTEILQQFANNGERQKYRDMNLSAEELTKIVKQKRKEIVDEIAPTYSLSEVSDSALNEGEAIRYHEDIAPVMEAPVSKTETTVAKNAPVAPVRDDEFLPEDTPIKTVDDRLRAKLSNSENELHSMQSLRESSSNLFDEQIAKLQSEYDSKKDKNTKVANDILRRIEKLKRRKADVDAENAKRISVIEKKIANIEAELQKDHTKQDEYERAVNRINRILEGDKADLDAEFAPRREALADKDSYIAKKAKELYNEISGLTKGVRASKQLGYLLDSGHSWNEIKQALVRVSQSPTETIMGTGTVAEQMVREALNDSYENDISSVESDYQKRLNELETKAETDRQNARLANTKKQLHQNIINNIKSAFSKKGLDFDKVLKNGKNLSTWATVDNTPSRVMKKSLGYKEGGLLADLTVNKVAQNETEGIKWLNTVTDRKDGLLAQLSKQYNIKPGSKEIQAAQMYAEGFYVADNDEIYKYGDEELAKDFPDVKVQNNIKGLVNDPRIRQFYDETLAMINESRVRNGYDPIPRLDNYYLHYRAMGDTFSQLGLPFNPNDIRAKDLPTDLNGVTIDNKPGQPFFASSMHRTGKRTTFDLFDGIERYATSAKNQIYHIDDIQTLRALRNYLADSFGQSKGLEGLDEMSDAEAQERIKEVYGSHMSTFAKFLNEEANILAGKTSLADRAVEGVLGRRAMTFLDTVNRQVGSNAVGYSASSAIVNLDAIPRAFAKLKNKADLVKAFSQMVSSTVSRQSDGFAESSPVIIRRKGADRFNRTLWQKMSDPGYVLMGAVDNVATELIARAKYNELTRNGMESQQAHFETDKWVSDLMGDRSLGQMPQIFNSKMLGLFTKFQLEVRNNLDSMFYDSIQEAKLSNEDIQNELEKNVKTAAKATWTIFQLAVAQHVFGKAFESIAGYNPSFDIIDAIIKALGFDDDDESEDTVLDNIEEGFLSLLEDMPYASTFTGGRIPISNALPIKELVTGKDEYGNEKSRWETLGEMAPYYLMPGGYGQFKKTTQGLGMFSNEFPIAGSYTDSRNLRFPVEDTLASKIQASLFGQWASENAQQYLDEGRSPLNDKQTQELIDTGMDFQDYWDYRDGLKGLTKLSEKADYINSLDLTTKQKNILINNIADREEDIDMSDYGKYDDFEEFDFAVKNPEKYDFFKNNGISYDDYADADEDGKRAYTWAYENPGKYTMSKAVSDDFLTFYGYRKELNDIEGDKDANGETVSGSKKTKVINYINNMDLDYGQKIILFRSMYSGKEDRANYNADIVEYLNGRDDISYEDMVTILEELDMKVSSDGSVTWD